MRLDRAKEIVTDDLNNRPDFTNVLLDYAEQLLIEAAKRLNTLRTYNIGAAIELLPGETEEKERREG